MLISTDLKIFLILFVPAVIGLILLFFISNFFIRKSEKKSQLSKPTTIDVPLELTWKVVDFKKLIWKYLIKELPLVFSIIILFYVVSFDNTVFVYGFIFIILFFIFGAREVPSPLYYLLIEKMIFNHEYILNNQSVAIKFNKNTTVINWEDIESFISIHKYKENSKDYYNPVIGRSFYLIKKPKKILYFIQLKKVITIYSTSENFNEVHTFLKAKVPEGRLLLGDSNFTIYSRLISV